MQREDREGRSDPAGGSGGGTDDRWTEEDFKQRVRERLDKIEGHGEGPSEGRGEGRGRRRRGGYRPEPLTPVRRTYPRRGRNTSGGYYRHRTGVMRTSMRRHILSSRTHMFSPYLRSAPR